MKTDVEELSPTRVKLTVEVPFEELKKNLDQAYSEVGQQVRVPGFRPGRVPPRVIDQRVGRAPCWSRPSTRRSRSCYGKALEEHEIVALGQPDYEITRLDDGKELAFTAEVDVRARSSRCPTWTASPVTVETRRSRPDQVEEYLGSLRERFASLKGVDRPVEDGDFVSIDLAASVDGKVVEDAQASGISYEVGSGSMLDGLDEALAGMSAGETATFTAELAGGQLAGAAADVQVTVNSVKVKELPALDDDFAQSASEFDTIGELRAGTRKQLEGMRQLRPGRPGPRAGPGRACWSRSTSRCRSASWTPRSSSAAHNLDDRLQRAGMTHGGLPGGQRPDRRRPSRSEFDTDARRSVKAGFILDKLAAAREAGRRVGRAGRLRDPAGLPDGRHPGPAGPAAHRERPGPAWWPTCCGPRRSP